MYWPGPTLLNPGAHLGVAPCTDLRWSLDYILATLEGTIWINLRSSPVIQLWILLVNCIFHFTTCNHHIIHQLSFCADICLQQGNHFIKCLFFPLVSIKFINWVYVRSPSTTGKWPDQACFCWLCQLTSTLLVVKCKIALINWAFLSPRFSPFYPTGNRWMCRIW